VVLSSAEEALAAAQRASAQGRPFRLALLDGELDRSGGFVLSERLLAESEAVILMTTVIDLDGRGKHRGRPPGLEHVAKPVSAGDLSAAIERALRRSNPESAAQSSTRECRVTPGQPLNVLLVEDNLVNQKVARRLLERAGHHVEVASDGMQALEMHRKQKFDCVLMDVQMPHMDGLAAARAIRAREAGTAERIPIVAMTAHALYSDRDRCLQAGMDDYLTKPISREKLLKILGAISDAAGSPVASLSGLS
jgi:CheY-like chemotaxis protein